MAVFISSEDLWVGESDQTARFTVLLSEPATETVTVEWTTRSDRAAQSLDYRGASGQLVFAPNEISKSILIELVDQPAAEGVETFSLQFSNPSNASLATTQAYAFITDNDTVASVPRLGLAETAYDLVTDEGDDFVNFVVRLDKASTGVVRVDYTTQDGSAESNADFEAVSGSLVFQPGEVLKTVPVRLLNDGAREAAEEFHLRLSNSSGAALDQPRATVRVLDDDASPVVNPFVTVSDIWVGEADAAARFVIRLSAPSDDPVSIEWTTRSDSAAQSLDYRGASGTITWVPGQVAKTIRVPLVDGTNLEDAEVFHLDLSNPLGATLAKARGTAVIVDNDETAAAPRISVHDVTVDEGQEVADVVVTLDAASSSTASVDYATRSGSAASGRDFDGETGTLVFLPGGVTKTISVNLSDDAKSETAEHFSVDFSDPVGAELGAERAMVTLVDNDGRKTTPTISIEDAWVDESDGVARFTLRLSGPSRDPVSVDWRTESGTAAQSLDYRGASGSASFIPGEVLKTLIVPLVDNDSAEGSEAFQVRLLSSTGGIIDGDRGTATAVIFDNDAPASLDPVFGPAAGGPKSAKENEDWVDIPVVLNAPAESVQRVDFATRDGSAKSGADFRDSSGTLVFLPGEVAKSVRVFMLDDERFDGDESFRLRFSEAGGPSESPAGLPRAVSIAIIDDEVPKIGTSGDNRISGGNGADLIRGLGGDDRLSGKRGDDILVGNSGDDILIGGGGDDDLRGGGGKDLLRGGSGEDRLAGGEHKDILDGGAGEDIFLFTRASDSSPGRSADRIRNFERGEDRIDLSRLDGNENRAGRQELSFIGRDGFSGEAGELRFGNEKLSADTDGDGSSDFEVLVSDVSRLGDDDLIL
jgi:hypothetical protein